METSGEWWGADRPRVRSPARGGFIAGERRRAGMLSRRTWVTSAAVGVASTIGRPVRRREDARILSGRSEFLDDVRLEGTLHVAFVRSPHASARITGIRRGPAAP
jgi:hypothetical protein